VFGESSPTDAVSKKQIVPQSDALEKPECEAIGSLMLLAVDVPGTASRLTALALRAGRKSIIRQRTVRKRV
jgi:hypothetical protein